jgi:uncharacterized protein (DUF302 family)
MLIRQVLSLPVVSKNGVVSVPSAGSFEDTIGRLEATLTSKGLTIFARIDFSGDAARSGLTMRPTRLVLFGNPKAGTPLMIASPSLAIDLPLKVLVSQDPDGKVWLSYNSPDFLKERHAVPDDLMKNIAGIVGLVDSASRAAE